jgi:hypothetical protein
MEPRAEAIARAFHNEYRRLAPVFGYKTTKALSAPWDDLEPKIKEHLISVIETLMEDGVIE